MHEMVSHRLFKVQFSLLVEHQKFCSRCRLTAPIGSSLISSIKGERKIKENGLTHCLGEGNPIVEIILRESWPRGSPKALQRQVSMSHGSHRKKFFGIYFSHACVGYIETTCFRLLRFCGLTLMEL